MQPPFRGRQVFKDEGECIVNRRRFYDVVVVEDEDNSVGDGGNLVDQRGQDGLGRRRLRRLEHAQRSFPDSGFCSFGPVQGGDKVSQETCQVVVAFIQGEPGDSIFDLAFFGGVQL